MTLTVAQLEELIERNKAKLQDYREHGTERMSKTGVKWCKSVTRDTLKRLRAQLKEARQANVVPDRQ